MNPRGLTGPERELTLSPLLQSGVGDEALCRRAVAECLLISFQHRLPPVFQGIRPLIAYGALNSTARGITLGRRIYIRHDAFDTTGGLPPYLLVHELAHVVQFLRDGTPRFLTRYLTEYFAGIPRYGSTREAYLNISYEIEARQVETFLPEHLQR